MSLLRNGDEGWAVAGRRKHTHPRHKYVMCFSKCDRVMYLAESEYT